MSRLQLRACNKDAYANTFPKNFQMALEADWYNLKNLFEMHTLRVNNPNGCARAFGFNLQTKEGRQKLKHVLNASKTWLRKNKKLTDCLSSFKSINLDLVRSPDWELIKNAIQDVKKQHSLAQSKTQNVRALWRHLRKVQGLQSGSKTSKSERRCRMHGDIPTKEYQPNIILSTYVDNDDAASENVVALDTKKRFLPENFLSSGKYKTLKKEAQVAYAGHLWFELNDAINNFLPVLKEMQQADFNQSGRSYYYKSLARTLKLLQKSISPVMKSERDKINVVQVLATVEVVIQEYVDVVESQITESRAAKVKAKQIEARGESPACHRRQAAFA